MIGTERIVIKGKEFLKIGLIEVNQKGYTWFLAKMPALELLSLYTVRPAQYDIASHTEFAKAFPDERSYYDYLISIDKTNLTKKDFQREANEGRLNEIQKFLTTQKHSFFPNSIIATCDLLNDSLEFGYDPEMGYDGLMAMDNIPDHFSIFYKDQQEQPMLLVPIEKDAILIIDGQHRLGGLLRTEYSVKKEFDLLVSFIIGFDRSVIAKQFYTINYEQKPVNKSILYELTGEFSVEVTELTFLHNLVKILNELDKSPFYKRIKMLGTTPKGVDVEDKSRYSISQAFMIDALRKSISSKSTGGVYQPIFLYYYKNKEYHPDLIRFVITYFNAIRAHRSDWDNPSRSVLSKGMGVGAFIKVLHFLFVMLFIDEFEMMPEKIKVIDEQFLKHKLQGIGNIDFSNNGPFGRSGSAGNMNKIKEIIVEKIPFFGFAQYSDFEVHFKKKYSPTFQNWLESKNLTK